MVSPTGSGGLLPCPAMLRRKRMPAALTPAFQAFCAQAERIEQARSALLSCLPVGRVDPAPVPVGLDVLRDELTAVRSELDAWHHDVIADHWAACLSALQEALDALPEAQRVAANSTELEELLGAISDVVEPLDAWHDAEHAWLALRVRS
jgi:hypothetical protein